MQASRVSATGGDQPNAPKTELSGTNASLSGTRHAKSPMNVLTWRKGALIGRGGVGKVYLALQPDTGALFAVKEVDLGAMDVEAVRDIRAEITALK